MVFLPRCLLTLLTLLILPFARAAITNITIDDTNPAFVWTDSDPDVTIPWASITPATGRCSYCSAQPPTDNIYNQTWHDGGNNSAGSLTFQGSAVYVYGIDLDNPANITFALDGTPAGFHCYTGTEQFVFNSLFFSARNLAQGANHTVSWVLHETKTNGSVGLFDYAIVTVEASASSTLSNSASSTTSAPASSSRPHSKPKVGPIVGGVVGGVAAIILVAALVIFSRRRPRSPSVKTDRSPGTGDVQPFAEAALSLSTTPPSSGNRGGGGEKTLDVAWNRSQFEVPAPPSIVAPSSTTTDFSSARPDLLSTQSQSETQAPSAREAELESRLALLEAHVSEHMQVQPPPYAPPPRREPGM